MLTVKDAPMYRNCSPVAAAVAAPAFPPSKANRGAQDAERLQATYDSVLAQFKCHNCERVSELAVRLVGRFPAPSCSCGGYCYPVELLGLVPLRG